VTLGARVVSPQTSATSTGVDGARCAGRVRPVAANVTRGGEDRQQVEDRTTGAIVQQFAEVGEFPVVTPGDGVGVRLTG
jgi:hypothetical protein